MPSTVHNHIVITGNLARLYLFLAQSFFERVCIRLVDLVRDVLANPRAVLVQFQRRVLLRDLLHTDQYLHTTPHGGTGRPAKPASIKERIAIW